MPKSVITRSYDSCLLICKEPGKLSLRLSLVSYFWITDMWGIQSCGNLNGHCLFVCFFHVSCSDGHAVQWFSSCISLMTMKWNISGCWQSVYLLIEETLISLAHFVTGLFSYYKVLKFTSIILILLFCWTSIKFFPSL